MDKECFVILCKNFVMEFAIQAWFPYLKRDIECLEKVQCRATKPVKRFMKLCYESTDCANWISHHWLTGVEAYNIRTGREKEKKEDFFIFSDTGYNLRGHCYKLAITCSRLEVRCNFFSQRVVGPWNLLPAHIIKAPTLNAFKNRYDSQKRGGHHKADASMPDTYKYK